MSSLHKVNRVSVVLPTYNEAGNIVDIVHALDRALSAYGHEVIVVDDNSPDGTWDLVGKEVAKGNSWLRIERRMSDRGLTKSIQRGIDISTGDVVCWLDCDFSHPPEELPGLLKKIEEGFDIAVASRFVQGGQQKVADSSSGDSALTVVLSTLLNLVLGPLLVPGFKDYTSGYIAIRREVLSRLRLRGDYGEYFIDLIFRSYLLGKKIIELPFISAPRRSGETKTAPNLKALFRRGIKYIWTIVRLQGVRVKRWFGAEI